MNYAHVFKEKNNNIQKILKLDTNTYIYISNKNVVKNTENIGKTSENITFFQKIEKPPKVRTYPTSQPHNRFLTPEGQARVTQLTPMGPLTAHASRTFFSSLFVPWCSRIF